VHTHPTHPLPVGPRLAAACLPRVPEKQRPPFHFLLFVTVIFVFLFILSQKLTEFNNFWQSNPAKICFDYLTDLSALLVRYSHFILGK